MKISQADIRQEIEQLRREDQRVQLNVLGSRGLAWLALVPAWTEDLAEKAGFPVQKQTLTDFLDQAEAQGLCERGDFEYDGEFWVRRGERGPTLEMLKTRHGIDFLRQEAFEAGLGIKQAEPSVPVAPLVRRWADLTSQMKSSPWQAADWLDQVVLELLEEGQTGEAMGWLDTAAPLGTLFGDKLETTVRLGNRRLELAYRRRQDERHIESFLRREEQIKAFEYLRDNRDGVWALHYLGVGGVGKTMLLRYITARLAPKLKVPTGRIDFDYISPDYPTRRPGQLLIELVTELLAYGLDRRQLTSFNNSVASLHEKLSGEQSAGDPLKSLKEHADLYGEMVQAFCRLIRELTRPGHPVILILDTCEELAKFQPPGSRLPSVEATFQILEDVHQACLEQDSSGGLPFRVVFAGRRPLAQRGFQWALKPHQAGCKRHLLPEKKEYLALHELRGFDHRETKEFLCRIKRVEIPSRTVYKALLKNSREVGRSADVEHTGFRHLPRRFRYNPFDIALFAEWLKAEPTLSAEQIASGVQDPYVEFRILERLRQRDLQDLLPALTLLARFDEAVLAPLIRECPGADFGAIYRELGDQEWIDYQHDEALDTTFLQIDTNLLPRLRKYYGCDLEQETTPERRSLLEGAKRQLAPILKGLIKDEDRRLTDLSPDYIDAALRVLPVEEAARLWDQIERRIPQEADWSWAQRVVGRILGEDGTVNSPSHRLWAAVQATLASAQLHLERDADVGALWQTVMDTAAAHPVEEIRRRLEQRAYLGRLAARPFKAEPVAAEQVARLLDIAESSVTRPADDQDRDGLDQTSAFYGHQLAAAACAALAKMLDAVEYHGVSFPDPARLQAWALKTKELDYPPDVVAYAHMLAGRAWVLSDGREEGEELLDRAAWMTSKLDDLAPGRWFDWAPPHYLESRLRLEAIRTLPASLSPRQWDNLRTWFMNALGTGDADDVDWERLVAESLSQELARRPVARDELDQARKRLRYNAKRRPTCLAHERAPHLVLALARGYLALGLAETALDLLAEHRAAAVSSGQDEDTQRAARTGIMEVVRRMRLQRERSLLDEWVRSDDPEVQLLAWPTAVLSGLAHGSDLPKPNDPSLPLRLMHAWNQCQSTPDEVMIPSDLASLEPNGPLWNEVDYDTAALLLDYLEQTRPATLPFDSSAWWRSHPRQAEEALRLALRVEALTGRQLGVTNSLSEQVPLRRRAEIALEEGELMVLRLPGQAIMILDRAVAWFKEAYDYPGRFIAAVCWALASAGTDASGETLKTVQLFTGSSTSSAYSDLVRWAARDWPAWTKLTDWASLPTEQITIMLDDANWGDWATRLLYYLGYAREREGDEASQRLLDRYRGLAPVELSFGGRGGAAPFPWRWSVDRLFSFWRKTVVELLGGLLGLGVFGGILYGAYRALNWVLEQLGLPETVGTLPRVGMYAVAWVLLIVLVLRAPRLYRAIMRPVESWLAAKTKLALYLKQDRPGLSVSFNLDMTVRRLRWTPPFVGTVHTVTQGETASPEWEEYRTVSSGLDEAIVTALADLRQRLGRRSLGASLIVGESGLHTPAWEGILTYALAAEDESPRVPLETLRLWRQVTSTAAPSPWAEAGWQLGLVQVVSSRSSAYAVERGWRASGAELVNVPSLLRDWSFEKEFAPLLERARGRDEAQIETPLILREILASRFDVADLRALCLELGIDPGQFSDDPSTIWAKDLALHLLRNGRTSEALAYMQRMRPEQNVPYKVLHLVGTPVRAGAELQWQVASTAETEAHYEQMTKDVDFGRVGELLPADEVPVRLAPLILLQAEPTQEIRARFAFDREQAGAVRTFAYKLVTAGAPAVLTLPALISEMVPDVIGSVAQALGGEKTPPDLDRLLAAAEATRRAIAGWESSPPLMDAKDQEELALDVCLFVRSEPVSEKETTAQNRKES